MAINLQYKSDIPRTPTNRSSEWLKFQELRLKQSVLTTTGALSYTAPSSGQTYTTLNGGEQGLLIELGNAVADYVPTSVDYNTMIDYFKQLDYQVVTFVGSQIRASKDTTFSNLNIQLESDITGLVTISFDGGITSKPIKDASGVQYNSLKLGFYQLVETSDSVILISSGMLKFSDVTGLSSTDGGLVTWSLPQTTDTTRANIIVCHATKDISNFTYDMALADGAVVKNNLAPSAVSYQITGTSPSTQYWVKVFIKYVVGGENYFSDGISVTFTTQSFSNLSIFGVAIDTTNSNPFTSVTYTNDAIGLTPMSGNSGAFSWGGWQPIFNLLDIKPCVVKNGVVQYYLNPNNYAQKADLTPSDITSGTAGDVMVEFGKPIYWKFSQIGTTRYIQFSLTQHDVSYKALAHTVGTTLKPKIYVSAYLGFYDGSKLRSLSGKTPTVNQTIGTFRTYAQANGSGYQQMVYYPLLMLQVLYMVFFKSLDSQTALGRGYVDGNASAINTGGANAKGMFYGEITGKLQNKFCGIEDFYGNCYYWIDGFFSDASRNILISNQSVFNDTGSGYTNYGQGATSDINGYISDTQGGTETGFVIKTGGGSASTYYCDYGALFASRFPSFGGSWANGSNAGSFLLNVSYFASALHPYVSSRLCFM